MRFYEVTSPILFAGSRRFLMYSHTRLLPLTLGAFHPKEGDGIKDTCGSKGQGTRE